MERFRFDRGLPSPSVARRTLSNAPEPKAPAPLAAALGASTSAYSSIRNMATAAGPATPQRPLPGGFVNTPAPAQPTIFAQHAATLRQNPQQANTTTVAANTAPAQNTGELPSLQKAAQSINQALHDEAHFPDLESYTPQGISGTYEIPASPAWQPFQKLILHDLPPRIIEQSNSATSALLMGVMPSLSHAWCVIDHALYLWDYTVPNPEIVGYEEQNAAITAIALVKPKPGVFVAAITDLIVVATTQEMMLLGVSSTTTPATGVRGIMLYNTRMSIPIRGLPAVRSIAASAKTGRIFFTDGGDDIFEFQYQSSEGWFRGKCARVCHTRSQYSLIVPETLQTIGQYFGPGTKPGGNLVQLCVDDSRDLLYTLSTTSEIKVYALPISSGTAQNSEQGIKHVLSRPFASMLQNTGHFTGKSPLLYETGVQIISLSVLPAQEGKKLSVCATTNTGCRLYFSMTRGYGAPADGQSPPNSMQILHIRFPPRDTTNTNNHPAPPQGQQMTAYNTSNSGRNAVDSTSQVLTRTHTAHRFPPGTFMAFLDDERDRSRDRVFLSAPDFARLKYNGGEGGLLSTRYSEFGQWISLPGTLAQVQQVTRAFTGASETGNDNGLGFGNEMAVQFQEHSQEVAMMTSVGVLTVRRRRLVDVFAGCMRYSVASTGDAHAGAAQGGDEQLIGEGREGDIKRFIRSYGRAETAATALAVACGQGRDVSPEQGKITGVTDPDVLEGARKVFIEHGGRPELNANTVNEGGNAVDGVRASPRCEGVSLYISRLVRELWRVKLLIEVVRPGVAVEVVCNIQLERLRTVQKDLQALQTFLTTNRSFIEGLAGPQSLGRVGNRGEEIALAGEHRAMTALLELVGSCIEGISFVCVLFEDHRVAEILTVLGDESRQRVKELTFEQLFVAPAGRDLARELVKAMVNRNIAYGSNVDTVADSLRRKCGSFCSADDVVVFKAQEQVKRASEAGGETETGRALLNESQRLFCKVASGLGDEVLREVVALYVSMSFWAGAVGLCLAVADARDPGRRALSWLNDNLPESDVRQAVFMERKKCYDLVFACVQQLDQVPAAEGTERSTIARRRRDEAHEVISDSEDQVFHTCLYDWYISNGNSDRLLDVDTAFVVDYLKLRAKQDRQHADLLWRYHAHRHEYSKAAGVQLDLAKGFFTLRLEERIEYLSRARTNASTRQSALADSGGRQSKQQLLREIGDLLDVATIQDDILQRMRTEPRLTPEKRTEVLQELDGEILGVDILFNKFADQAAYHDVCLLIYQVADHRNPADIRASWQLLIGSTHDAALADREVAPWEIVGEKVREMGKRLGVDDAVFPVQTLLPMLMRYALQPREPKPPVTWAVDLFRSLDVPWELLLQVLEGVYYGNEAPFVGRQKRQVGGMMVYVLHGWVQDGRREGLSDEDLSMLGDCLNGLVRGGDLDAGVRGQAEELLQSLGRGGR